MLYLMLLFVALFIFHIIRSGRFEKENADLLENKKETQLRESEITL